MADQYSVYAVECACKSVRTDVKGLPFLQSYCHCASCAKYHQITPVSFVMFPADAISIAHGSEHVQRCSVRKKELGRYFCKGCGFRLYNQLDGVPYRGMPVSNLQGMEFQPTMHVFCGDASPEALQRFREDGLPKFKDMAKETGGSGEQLQIS